MGGPPFVGRVKELEALQGALAADTPRPLLFVHGPGGIGKSALLAAHARGARESGRSVRLVDGRDSERAEQALDAALTDLAGSPAPEAAAPGGLLLLDSYEQAPALGAVLREKLPARLESGTRVVVAGRRPPEPEWTDNGWAELMLELPLSPLAEEEARLLLQLRGVEEGAGARIAAWGAGHPLALTVAADAVAAGSDLDLEDLDADELLASALIRRLGRDELDGADHDVLAVAAIARAVDARLLEAVIPEVDGDRAETWLRGLSFAEPLGTRVTLHARMRAALSGSLRVQDLAHEQELRARIADHLYGRIVLGEKRLFPDLAEMLTDPALRWATTPERMTHRVTGLEPGDRERIGELLGVAGQPWWENETRRWFEEAADRIMVARDSSGCPSAWAIAMTPATAPSWADEDPVLGPWLADARVEQPDGDVILVRNGGPLVPVAPGAIATGAVAGNFAVILRSGLPSLRRWYVSPQDEYSVQFMLAAGYQHVPNLDAEYAGSHFPCYIVDHGPGGIFRAARDVVYLGLGRTPPPIETTEDPDPAGSVVRDALRSFHDPRALASSPLASGVTVEERAHAARELLRNAIAAAFGSSDEEQMQRSLLERGYLDPEGGHEDALAELEMSPRTYYERLAAASERVESYVAATQGLLAGGRSRAGTVPHDAQLTADLLRARQRLIDAREDERRRLGRDLHDSLGPTLAGMAFTLDAARNLIETDPAQADRVIGELRQEAQGAIGDLRRVAHELRPPALDELGLISAIRTFAERLSAGAERLQVSVAAPEPFPELPAAAEVAGYRIVREALTNVARHAKAADCLVELTPHERELRIEVADDGIGLDPRRQAGVGLASMTERATELGGRVELSPREGGGTRLFAVLPFGVAQ